MQISFAQSLRIGLIVALPFVLVLSNVRLVLHPWFPAFEYGRSGFPPDGYGLTTSERKLHAGRAVNYLLRDVGIGFLSEQRFADGSLLYNERELRHMQDVKEVVVGVLWIWRTAAILVLLAGGVLACQPATRPLLWTGVGAGAAIVVLLLAVILVYVLLNFNSFFTNFHQVFFERGSWMFSYSDTLIRLFPLRFWSDVVMIIGGASLLEGLLLWWGARLI